MYEATGVTTYEYRNRYRYWCFYHWEYHYYWGDWTPGVRTEALDVYDDPDGNLNDVGGQWLGLEDTAVVYPETETGTFVLAATYDPVGPSMAFTEWLEVEIYKAKPFPFSVEFIDPVLDIDAPLFEEPWIHQAYTAHVLSQYGDYMYDADIWIDEETFIDYINNWDDENDMMQVNQMTVPGSFVLHTGLPDMSDESLATAGEGAPAPNFHDEIEVDIHKEESVPTYFSLEGQESIMVPYLGQDDVTEEYQGSILDQYGLVMEEVEAVLIFERLTSGIDPDQRVDIVNNSIVVDSNDVDQWIAITAKPNMMALRQSEMDGFTGAILEDYLEVHIYRDDPFLNSIQLQTVPFDRHVVPVDVAIEPDIYSDIIDVPYFDGEEHRQYYARGFDQYGEVLGMHLSVHDPMFDLHFVGDPVDGVDFDGLHMFVDYSADAGMFEIYATATYRPLDSDTVMSNTPEITLQKDEVMMPSMVDIFVEDIKKYEEEDALEETHRGWRLFVPKAGRVVEMDLGYMIYDLYHDEYQGDMLVDSGIQIFNEDGSPNTTYNFDGNILKLTPADEGGRIYFKAFATFETDNDLITDDMAYIESDELHVKIIKFPSRIDKVEIVGADSINVPRGDDVVEDYEVVVLDQYGFVFEDVETYMRSKAIEGVSFDGESQQMTVTSDAPHGYMVLSAFARHVQPTEQAQALVEEYYRRMKWDFKVVTFEKTPLVTGDDVTNDVFGLEEGIEFRFTEGGYEPMIPDEGLPMDEGWKNTSPHMKFPGNVTVEFRYNNRWEPEYLEIDVEDAALEAECWVDIEEVFDPSEAVELVYTVIPPTITGPFSFVNSVTITVVQVEEPDENESWYEHETLYRINGGSWIVGPASFQITSQSFIEAKTVTTINSMIINEYDYEPLVHESVIVSLNSVPTDAVPGVVTEVTVGGEEEIIEDLTTPLGAVTFNASYLTGYEDGTFRPVRNITRAEMATIFARILALNIGDTTTLFGDVTGSEWFAGFINGAYSANVVMPRAINLYGSEDGITRAEIATIINQYWTYLAIDVEPLENGFNDTAGLGTEPAILKAVAQGVMTGYDGNMFMPNAYVTRQQAAEMINTLLARAEVKPLVPSYSDVTPDMMFYGEIEAASTSALISQQ